MEYVYFVKVCWGTASGGGRGLECRGIVEDEVARGFQFVRL